MSDWEKIRIGDLFDLEKGSLQSTKCVPGKFNFITAANDWKTHNKYSHDCEAIIYAVAASGSLGRAHYVNGKFTSSDLCFIMTEKNSVKYPINFPFYHNVFNFLKSDIVKRTKTGTSKEAINRKNFSNYKIPHIDIAHQELWSKNLTEINIIKDGLINEGLNQAYYLTQLRQSILQEAIEGKLTADWRKENPVRKGDPDFDAEALLAKIKIEKEKLVASGKIKKQKLLAPIKPEEVPFELPKGWVWTRLGEITELITSGSRDWAKYYRDNGRAKFLRMGNLSHTWFNLRDDFKYVNPPSTGEGTRTSLIENDLLLSVTGDVGWKALIPPDFGEAYINQHTALVRFISYVRGKFFPIILCSPLAWKQFRAPQRGIKNSFRLTDVSTHLFALPSLLEQNAIIERIDQYFAVVDELEKQVEGRKRYADKLMQTVLREAFE